MLDQHGCKGEKRRVAHFLAKADLLFVKSEIILFAGVLQGIVLWIICLNQHSTAEVTAARASGNLGQQLKCSFGGPEVGQAESKINRYDADQCDVGEVMSLRDHLGPD